MAVPFLPCENSETRYFVESGLLSYHNDCYSAVVGLRKGGVILIFDKKSIRYADCGYRVSYGNATAAATNWQDPSYKVDFSNNCAMSKGKMNKVHLKSSTPFILFGLRIASFVFGKRIIDFLKKKLILVDKHANITFERNVSFCESKINITDTLTSDKSVLYEAANNMSLRLVASGKFFSATDLYAQRRIIKQAKQVIVKREYDLSSFTVNEEIY